MSGASSDSETLSILRSNSLSTVLAREIERVILGGELNPGDRINENQLAIRFGTSRGPIREALRSLDALGLVELIPNRGMFIRKLEPRQVAEAYDVRAVLFGYAGRLLAARATIEQIAELRRFTAAMDRAAERHDFEAYYPLNLAFHDFIVDSAGNGVLAAQYRGLVKRLRLYRARSLMVGDSLLVSNREHQAMVEAIASGDVLRAQDAHFQHVEQAKKRLLAAVEAGSLIRE